MPTSLPAQDASVLSSARIDPVTDDGVFFDACGGRTSFRLLISNKDEAVEAASFDRPYLVLGRSERCDVCLSHHDVSFRHLYLQIIGARVYFCDLASRTGVVWSRATRSKYRRQSNRNSGWMDAGDELSVGPFVVRLATHGLSDQPAVRKTGFATTRSDRHVRLPVVALRLLNSKKAGHVWHIAKPITLIGSHENCDVRLAYQSVSQVHAGLAYTPSGLWVVDLCGRDGIRVNGREVRHARLHYGDRLQIGRRLIKVTMGSFGEEPAATRNSAPIPMAQSTDDPPFPEPDDRYTSLLERMATIDRERQSRWQRMLNVLSNRPNLD